jgi:NAD(P)-dependent dehydrogenase (short-subunit alcohol dehydrogenase family)
MSAVRRKLTGPSAGGPASLALDGRVVIVTGGAQNIGRTLCLALAAQGASVVVADISDPMPVVEEINDGIGVGFGVRVDVADRTSTEEMAHSVMQHYGRIDVLINNAAFFRKATIGHFTEISDAEWDLCFAVNVRGLWSCCRAVHPYMKRAGSGKIINISSTVAWEGVPNYLHYVASKSAVVGLTRALAREVGDDGITVNTVAPDLIPDDEINASQPGANEHIISNRCIKRTETPEDLVGPILFLSSAASDFISGQALLVNGGTMFY